MEQSAFRSNLNLGVSVGIVEGKIGVFREGLTETLKPHGMTVGFQPDASVECNDGSTYAFVVLGNPVGAEDVSRIGCTLANHGANIDSTRGIADCPVTGLELLISIPDPKPGAGTPLRRTLTELAQTQDIDIAIERVGSWYRSKCSTCFDMDSTLIIGGIIEILATHAGREAGVVAATGCVMRGKLDFAESLHG